MLWGLTGCSGTGSTTVSKVWGNMGARVCSLDGIGHRFLSKDGVKLQLERRIGIPGLSELPVSRIRKELRNRAFSDPAVLCAINETLHPRLIKWTAFSASVARKYEGVSVLDAALVFELELENILDFTVTVKDSIERAVNRLQDRDHISAVTAADRWKNQIKIEDKCFRSHFVIDNCGTIKELEKKATDFYRDVILRMEDANWHTKPEKS